MLKAPIEIVVAPSHAAARPTAPRDRDAAPSGGFSVLIDNAGSRERTAPKVSEKRESVAAPRDKNVGDDTQKPADGAKGDAAPASDNSSATAPDPADAVTDTATPVVAADPTAMLALQMIPPVAVPVAILPAATTDAVSSVPLPAAPTINAAASVAANPQATGVVKEEATIEPAAIASIASQAGIAAPKAAAKPAKPATTIETQSIEAAPATDADAAALSGAAKALVPANEKTTDEKPVATIGQPTSEPSPAEPAPRAPHAVAPATPQNSDIAMQTIPLPPTQPPIHAATFVSPTAHLTATIATDAPVPLNGLAVEIATRSLGGVSSFAIRLDPADLGRIDVRLDVDNKGQVTSHLTVEKPETLAMLRQDAPQLQRALNDAGLKTADNALQFSLGDQTSAHQNAHRDTERQPHQLIVRDDDIIAAPLQLRGYGRLLTARGGIDIRV